MIEKTNIHEIVEVLATCSQPKISSPAKRVRECLELAKNPKAKGRQGQIEKGYVVPHNVKCLVEELDKKK